MRLGRRLVSQDSFQGREAVSAVLHAAPHRAHHVTLVISVQKPKHLQRLMLAVSLFTFEPFEVGHASFPQLGKALSQSLHLFFMIARRCMGGIDATFP